MVEAVECGHCGQGLPKQLASRAGVITCPRCGGSIARPASGNAAGGSAGPAKKPSQTAKALAEALRAMEEKESSRKGKEKGRPAQHERAAFELGKKPPSAAPAAAPTTAAAPDAKGATSLPRWRLNSRQSKVAACCAAVLVIGLSGYAALAPSARQSAQHDRVLELKQDADRLAAAGQNVEAFKKYGEIVLRSASEPVHGSDARRAVEEARQARLRLQPLVRDAEEKAKLAKFTR
jgi:hypothetical protein